MPILLGTFLLDPAVPDGPRLYGIVIVVVVASVLVQGSTVPARGPTTAHRLNRCAPRARASPLKLQ